jgi:hypothetical protein
MNTTDKTVMRITGHEDEKRFFDSVCINPDKDSMPEIAEWYWTLNLTDAMAAQLLFTANSPSRSKLTMSERSNIHYKGE